jgi:rubrerythrin
MYPAFLSEATAGNLSAAIRTFTRALEAEKTHAQLYREAIKLVGAGEKESWVGSERDFYVCAVCGYTSATPEEEHCPVCNLSWDKFEVIR